MSERCPNWSNSRNKCKKGGETKRACYPRLMDSRENEHLENINYNKCPVYNGDKAVSVCRPDRSELPYFVK